MLKNSLSHRRLSFVFYTACGVRRCLLFRIRVAPVDSGVNKADDLSAVAVFQDTDCSRMLGSAAPE
jgi:hypothetical protein